MAASAIFRLAPASDTRAFGFLVSLALHAGVLAAYGLWSQSLRLIPERREEPVTVTIMALPRSEEHKSELQSLMRISYAVFCLQTKTQTHEQDCTLLKQHQQ